MLRFLFVLFCFGGDDSVGMVGLKKIDENCKSNEKDISREL